MQLLLKFTADKDLIFDDNNIRIMQGFIYKKLTDIGARNIHEKTFVYENKVFRHFCFSDILSSYKVQNNLKNYGKELTFLFSTSLDYLISDFCNSLYNDEIVYNQIHLKCNYIYVIDSGVYENNLYVETFSPVVVDKTSKQSDGKNKRVFFSPLDDEFEHIVKANLIAKYNSLNDIKIDDASFSIYDVSNVKKVHRKYMKPTKRSHIGIHINGYTFKCMLKGDKRLIKIALNSGLGAKNAQGFGFIKKIV